MGFRTSGISSGAGSQVGLHKAHRPKAYPLCLQVVQLLVNIPEPVMEGEPAAGHEHDKFRLCCQLVSSPTRHQRLS